MIDYRNIIKNREIRLKMIDSLRFIPTKPYLELVYLIKTGKVLHLKKPITFCDKLNWLKINDQKEMYTQLVDKIKVHDYLKEVLGEDIGFPVLGQWNHFCDIDFSTLPEKFVLKCNHDSGSVKIIKDKSAINRDELDSFFESRLKVNPFNIGREYPYRNVQPKILAEAYMTPEGKNDISDYKFFCFDGKPAGFLTVLYQDPQGSYDLPAERSRSNCISYGNLR